MKERQPARAEREVKPKDVFARSNMPSRWERLTNVAPKTVRDRKYLAFVAARYRGDQRLPHPDALEPPRELHTREFAYCVCMAVGAIAIILAVARPGHSATCVTPRRSSAPSRCGVRRRTRSSPDATGDQPVPCAEAPVPTRRIPTACRPLDSEDIATLNKMINNDEGTLAYCAAKIASEIEKEPDRDYSELDIMPIDLWEELAEVGESARQIAEDRDATQALVCGRLSDDPDVRATIDEDNQLRKEALTLLAARVHAFADYRDRLHLLSMSARRETNALSRAVRRVADQQATARPF